MFEEIYQKLEAREKPIKDGLKTYHHQKRERDKAVTQVTKIWNKRLKENRLTAQEFAEGKRLIDEDISWAKGWLNWMGQTKEMFRIYISIYTQWYNRTNAAWDEPEHAILDHGDSFVLKFRNYIADEVEFLQRLIFFAEQLRMKLYGGQI